MINDTETYGELQNTARLCSPHIISGVGYLQSRSKQIHYHSLAESLKEIAVMLLNSRARKLVVGLSSVCHAFVYSRILKHLPSSTIMITLCPCKLSSDQLPRNYLFASIGLALHNISLTLFRLLCLQSFFQMCPFILITRHTSLLKYSCQHFCSSLIL